MQIYISAYLWCQHRLPHGSATHTCCSRFGNPHKQISACLEFQLLWFEAWSAGRYHSLPMVPASAAARFGNPHMLQSVWQPTSKYLRVLSFSCSGSKLGVQVDIIPYLWCRHWLLHDLATHTCCSRRHTAGCTGCSACRSRTRQHLHSTSAKSSLLRAFG